jgi:hypothetical protein
MDWMNWVKNNLGKVVAVPITINTIEFAVLFLQSIQDGVITDEELHQMMQVGSGVSLIFLTAVLGFLKLKK